MERKITNDVVTEIGLTQRNKILTLEGDVAAYDLRGMKKEFPNITTLKIKNGVTAIRISNRTFPNIRKVVSESPLFETREAMLIRKSTWEWEKGVLLNAFCKSEEEALYFKNVAVIADMALDGCDTKKVFNTKHLTCVKNPRLKSRASDSPSGFFSLATRLHLPFYLLSCFICPMHLPSGRVLLRLSVRHPYADSPTAVQALKVDSHHGSHASPRYRCFVIWLFPFPECLSICDRFYTLLG